MAEETADGPATVPAPRTALKSGTPPLWVQPLASPRHPRATVLTTKMVPQWSETSGVMVLYPQMGLEPVTYTL